MKPEMRQWLSKQIDRSYEEEADNSYNWNDVKNQCLNNFLRRATDKVRDTGSLKRKEGYGRNELSLAKAKNKETWDE